MLHQKHTALLAASVALALGILHSLMKAGIAVPKEISLMGFDDVEAAAYVYPDLTTVKLDWGGLGKLGAQRLFDLLSDTGIEQPAALCRYPVHVVWRGSCEPPAY